MQVRSKGGKGIQKGQRRASDSTSGPLGTLPGNSIGLSMLLLGGPGQRPVRGAEGGKADRRRVPITPAIMVRLREGPRTLRPPWEEDTEAAEARATEGRKARERRRGMRRDGEGENDGNSGDDDDDAIGLGCVNSGARS